MKAIKWIVPVCIVIAGAAVYHFWYSTSALATSVFDSINKGRLFAAPTGLGRIVVDLDDITTDIFVENSVVKNSTPADIRKVIDVKSDFFDIPTSVQEYEEISSSSDTASYLFSTEAGIERTKPLKYKNLKYRVSTRQEEFFLTLLFIQDNGDYKLAALLRH